MQEKFRSQIEDVSLTCDCRLLTRWLILRSILNKWAHSDIQDGLAVLKYEQGAKCQIVKNVLKAERSAKRTCHLTAVCCIYIPGIFVFLFSLYLLPSPLFYLSFLVVTQVRVSKQALPPPPPLPTVHALHCVRELMSSLSSLADWHRIRAYPRSQQLIPIILFLCK